MGKDTDKEKQFYARINAINPAILDALHHKTDFSFRLNRHRDTSETIASLEAEGFAPKAVSWHKGAFTLPIADRKRIVKSRAYTANEIYIQNLSSILAAESLDVAPEDWVLDLAAAPGGKSLILSEKAAKVSAVEPDKSRFFRMKRNFKEHGAKNIQCYNKDGRFVHKATGAIFDKVFLDAPCSSEAHIDLGEGITWWSPKRIKRFSKLQKALIVSAFEALKPGGEMIYATCTFAPEENEGVLDFLLSRYKNARIVPADTPISNRQAALEGWEDQRFDPQTQHAVRILPEGAYSGFFFAKIVKG